MFCIVKIWSRGGIRSGIEASSSTPGHAAPAHKVKDPRHLKSRARSKAHAIVVILLGYFVSALSRTEPIYDTLDDEPCLTVMGLATDCTSGCLNYFATLVVATVAISLAGVSTNRREHRAFRHCYFSPLSKNCLKNIISVTHSSF